MINMTELIALLDFRNSIIESSQPEHAAFIPQLMEKNHSDQSFALFLLNEGIF